VAAVRNQNGWLFWTNGVVEKGQGNIISVMAEKRDVRMLVWESV